MVLTLLAILVAALVVLGGVAALVPPRITRLAVYAICGAVVVLAIAAMAGGTGGGALVLPVGPPGVAMRLALDPLAASFLLLLFLAAPCVGTAPLPLAAMLLTVLAGDGFVLAIGLLLLGGTGPSRSVVAATVCLIAALALTGAPDNFAAIRAAPPEGWMGAAALLLTLAGALLLVSISAPIAAFLLIRVLLDLCGPMQPLWWGVPLLLVGAVIAVAGPLRAALADTMHGVVAAGTLHLFGIATIGIGVALLARAVDLPSMAARALDAAWLALVCLVLCRTLLLVGADAVERGAGTRRLDLMGGLIHRMPATACACLVGLVTLAAVPPGLGFASFWLLVQSLLSAARFGGFALQVLSIVVAVLAASSVGLSALAAVRLFGVAFLGRPRTPRAAVADEAPRPVRLVMGGLAASIALLGVLPALALLPAVRWTGATRLPWLALGPGIEMPGYVPLALAALLAVLGIVLFRRLRGGGEQRREPAWSDGFAAPPAWLPFGDPATQSGPASFTEPVRRFTAPAPWVMALRRQLGRRLAVARRTMAALIAP